MSDSKFVVGDVMFGDWGDDSLAAAMQQIEAAHARLSEALQVVVASLGGTVEQGGPVACCISITGEPGMRIFTDANGSELARVRVSGVVDGAVYRFSVTREEVSGFGFARADEVALRMGLPPDSPARIQAALLHTLKEAEGEGHCYVRRGALVRHVTEELLRGDVRAFAVSAQLERTIAASKLVDAKDWIYRPEIAQAEALVSRVVRERAA